jgi:ribosomal protein S18 acetylase RimI-like enzyme
LKYSAVSQPAFDIGLVAHLEAAHAWAVHNYVSSLQEQRPELHPEAISVGGGQAFYAGSSPFSFAVGLGLTQPVTPADVDLVERFYRKHRVPAKIDITPATHPLLSELTETRGYRVADLTTVLVLDLESARVPQPLTNIFLRWARPEDCDVWVDTVARNFFVIEPGEDRRRSIACVFHAPHALNVIALVDQQVAGVAGCMIPHRGGTAVIYASCTQPEFRRLGVHREMLRLRISTARAAGCSTMVATALPGSDSERNLVRSGFEICYVKTSWVKQ